MKWWVTRYLKSFCKTNINFCIGFAVGVGYCVMVHTHDVKDFTNCINEIDKTFIGE